MAPRALLLVVLGLQSSTALQLGLQSGATLQLASRRPLPPRTHSPVCQAPDTEPGFTEGFVAASGLFASPIVILSLYNVAATGGGLDPGPYGLLGACEGVSYLAAVGVVGTALYSKVTTGSGLPAGPLGLLGLSEGLSFLSVVGALLVFPLKELGVVGDPATAIVNVPELAAAVSATLGPLWSSLVASVSGAVSSAVAGIQSSEGMEGGMPSLDFSSLDLSSFKIPEVKLPEGLPSLPELSLPEGLPSLPEGLPSLPSLPEGLPSLPSLPEGLPSLPDGLPSLPDVSLPELSPPSAPPTEGLFMD